MKAIAWVSVAILGIYLLGDTVTLFLLAFGPQIGHFLLYALALIGFWILLALVVRALHWSVRFLPDKVQRVLLFKIGH